MPIHAKRSGSWDQLPSGNLYVKVNGSWRIVKQGYARVNGTWRTVHLGSDPKTITLRPDSTSAHPTRFGRGTSWGTSSDGPWAGSGSQTLATGRYVNISVPRYFGVIRWRDTTGGATLASELAERPVVKSATLRLKRHNVSHGVSTPGASTVYVSKYLGSTTTTNPNCGDISFADFAAASTNGLTFGSDVTINLNSNGDRQDLIEHAADGKHFALTNVNSGMCVSESGFDQGYIWYYGQSGTLAQQPLLTVELDYI